MTVKKSKEVKEKIASSTGNQYEERYCNVFLFLEKSPLNAFPVRVYHDALHDIQERTSFPGVAAIREGRRNIHVYLISSNQQMLNDYEAAVARRNPNATVRKMKFDLYHPIFTHRNKEPLNQIFDIIKSSPDDTETSFYFGCYPEDFLVSMVPIIGSMINAADHMIDLDIVLILSKARQYAGVHLLYNVVTGVLAIPMLSAFTQGVTNMERLLKVWNTLLFDDSSDFGDQIN